MQIQYETALIKILTIALRAVINKTHKLLRVLLIILKKFAKKMFFEKNFTKKISGKKKFC